MFDKNPFIKHNMHEKGVYFIDKENDVENSRAISAELVEKQTEKTVISSWTLSRILNMIMAPVSLALSIVSKHPVYPIDPV